MTFITNYILTAVRTIRLKMVSGTAQPSSSTYSSQCGEHPAKGSERIAWLRRIFQIECVDGDERTRPILIMISLTEAIGSVDVSTSIFEAHITLARISRTDTTQCLTYPCHDSCGLCGLFKNISGVADFRLWPTSPKCAKYP